MNGYTEERYQMCGEGKFLIGNFTPKFKYNNGYKKFNSGKSLVYHMEKFFKCFACSFETNNRLLLKRHTIDHFDNLMECLYCNFKTNRRKTLNKHTQKHTKTSILFECLKCNFESFSNSKLKIHSCDKWNEKLEKEYRCFICKSLLNSRHKLRAHIKHHNKNILDIKYSSELNLSKLKTINYIQKTKKQKSKHFKNHLVENISLLICPFCPFLGKQKLELKLHILNHLDNSVMPSYPKFEANIKIDGLKYDETVEEPDAYQITVDLESSADIDNNNVFRCPKCDFKTTVEKEMKMHLKKHLQVLQCKDCNFITYLNRKLQDHYKEAHSNKKRVYKMKEIPKTSDKENSLVQKDENISSDFKCFDCSFKTCSRDKFKIHMTECQSAPQNLNCSVCNFISQDKEELRIHVLKHYENQKVKCPECHLEVNQRFYKMHVMKHSNVKIHNCSLCSYGTNRLYHLKRHTWQVHSSTKVLKCSKCTFESRDRKEYRSHVLSHEKVVMKCPECDFEMSARYYKQHILTHSENKLFRCGLCPYSASKVNYLRNHIEKKHSEPKILTCSSCSFETTERIELRKHFRKEHKKTEKKQCNVCFMEMDSQYIRKHMVIHSEVKHHKCPFCTYKTNRRAHIKKHLMNVHSNVKLLTCSNCDFKTRERKELRKHVILNHENEIVKCCECRFKCLADSFGEHITTHVNSEFIQCSTCSFKCTSRSDLKSHLLLMHPERKWIKCKVCSFETLDREQFENHLVTHAETKIYKCPDCSYETPKRYHMNRHLVVHSNFKSIKCPHCNFMAKCNEYLQSHLLTHAKPVHECSECDYKTNRKKQLKQHLIIHMIKEDKNDTLS
ncbi:UNVERIFIED_CONTAM: hypothetical protein RMT77_011736 [Armadillidium vulgare]